MTFQADYPDLTGLSPGQQIDELFNKFISLSRQVEYAVNHIDAKNFTSTFNKRLEDGAGNLSELIQTVDGISSTVTSQGGSISQLQQTADGLTLSVESNTDDITDLEQSVDGISSDLSGKADKTAAYYKFDSTNLNIYSGGIKIFNGPPANPGDAVFYADENGVLNLRELILRSADGMARGKVTSYGTFFNELSVGVINNETSSSFSSDDLYAFFTVEDGHCVMKDGTYLSYAGSTDPSKYAGLEFYSNYQRPISSSTGIPTDAEKKEHSGVSLHGDVVISNFNDDYYRYPVVADANYKVRIYMEENGALVVARYNAKTNAVDKTCRYQGSIIE